MHEDRVRPDHGRGLISAIVALLLAGCAGSLTIPVCDRPLNEIEHAEIARLADYISSVGERWEPYADKVRVLLEIERICVGDLTGGNEAWAQWAPMKSRIINDPTFFCYCPINENVNKMWSSASVLVVEAAHIMFKSKRTHHLQKQFLDEALTVTMEDTP